MGPGRTSRAWYFHSPGSMHEIWVLSTYKPFHFDTCNLLQAGSLTNSEDPYEM